jgi:hypothetical protein
VCEEGMQMDRTTKIVIMVLLVVAATVMVCLAVQELTTTGKPDPYRRNVIVEKRMEILRQRQHLQPSKSRRPYGSP